MSRRLDVGIASYENPLKLDETLRRLLTFSRTEIRVFVIDNASPDPLVREIIQRHAAADARVVPVFLDQNTGYAGAVSHLLGRAESEYIAYIDNDAWIQTAGWDEIFASYLDRFHEIGMIFPGGGAFPIDRGAYLEIMWGVGCCWMINRLVMGEIALRDRGFPAMKPEDYGKFDTTLGHQEEVDFQTRLRLAGWIPAAAPDVTVYHHESSTTNPASIERINRGVVRWVDKWVAYFCGARVNYHSPNVMRIADWPPFALYLEEYFKARMPELNAKPEEVLIDGVEHDLIRVPRLKNFYRNRII